MASCFPDAIIDAGGTPILLPLTDNEEAMDELVELCDDFALQGGPDVDPARFGDTTPYDKAPLCPERDAFELPLVQKILATDKPLFTTCRGTQLLNVALGGTLCMNVPSRTPRPGMQLWRHTEL